MDFYVILACHNRREATLQCLQSTYKSASNAGLSIDVTLYDDGSLDDTASSVAELFPDVSILKGSGRDYWAKSMAAAEADVFKRVICGGKSSPYILWLNDDVILDADALGRLQAVAEVREGEIIVGAMRDPVTQEVTYSGLTRQGIHPLSYKIIKPTSRPEKIDVFNGNLVLVPFGVARAMGGIDGDFSHALADIEYGLRAKAQSISVTLAPGTFGACSRNAAPAPQGIGRDWKRFIGPKGAGNPHSMKRILKLAAPGTWPAYFFGSYALWWGRRLLHELKMQTKARL